MVTCSPTLLVQCKETNFKCISCKKDPVSLVLCHGEWDNWITGNVRTIFSCLEGLKTFQRILRMDG